MPRLGDVTYLDKAWSSWDRRERNRIPCDAAPDAVMRASEQVTWREIPVFRGLMAVRSAGRLQLTADEHAEDGFVGAGLKVLARTPEEILVRGIQRFSGSRTVVQLPSPDLAAFRDFDVPGCMKSGLNFRCAHELLITETRVSTTDARSRRLFGLYWLYIRGGSGHFRLVWLRAIRRRAVSSTSGWAPLRRESGRPL